jgi:hypothetical protein
MDLRHGGGRCSDFLLVACVALKSLGSSERAKIYTLPGTMSVRWVQAVNSGSFSPLYLSIN